MEDMLLREEKYCGRSWLRVGDGSGAEAVLAGMEVKVG